METQQQSQEQIKIEKSNKRNAIIGIAIFLIAMIVLIAINMGDSKNQPSKDLATNNASKETKESPIQEQNTQEQTTNEYKKIMMEAFKFAMDGYKMSGDAVSYGLANNYTEGLRQANEAKNLYSKSLDKMKAITPPENFKKMNDFTIAGIEKFNQANNFIIVGLNTKDISSISKASQLLDEGNLLIKQATEKLSENK